VKTCAALTLICLIAVTGCASPEKKPTDTEPEPTTVTSLSESAQRGEPFAGLWLADSDSGDAVVRGIVAGPAAIAGLREGDHVLRIDDTDVDASGALAIIESSSPGARLTLQVMRETKPMTITLVIDEHGRWATPSAFRSAVPFADTGLAESPTVPEYPIDEVLSMTPDAEPIVARLDQMFSELARDDSGYHKLPLIRSAMMHPENMTAWRDALTEQLRPFENERDSAIPVMCDTLALQCPAHSMDALADAASLAAFAQSISDANQTVREVFKSAQTDRVQASADLQFLMQATAADRTLIGQPGVVRGIRATQLSMRVELSLLLATAQQLLANAVRPVELAGDARRPPAKLAGIVEGEIVDYVELDGGFVVVGGPGPNRYAMDQLYAVIDVAGDDVYEWGVRVPRETQTVVDMAGNDRYHATRGGPGAGWLGVSVLIDLSGADQYESELGGCGAGAFGFGFLFDDAGADTYQCAAWSAGAGLYGGGVLIDRGQETDIYHSQVFSQGVGGPRGIGILIDNGGGDFYRANGPVPSAYDSAGSFMAFSQGVGVGIRPYDFGGVGVLLDLGGDDRYEGGEFSQGGGYYWGVGSLFDESGNDLYYGNRYAQGFAAHQAFGMLTDISGDDVYWSMTAAGQAAAWDQSIAMLFEMAGDDVYRAQSLSQGAAAQQARALLHDVSGDDSYWSSSEVAQGVAGDNSYHFQAEDPVYSFGVLFDESGDDRYSTGVFNGEVLLRLNTGSTQNGRGIAGVAIDRE
jgi:hypothetical protein